MTDQQPFSGYFKQPLNNNIKFCSPPGEEVIRIDKEGFHYRGEFIEDAGEAHRLMVEFLNQNTKPEPQTPTNEEIYAWQDQCIRLTEARQADHWWAFDDTSDVASTVRAALAHWGCR